MQNALGLIGDQDVLFAIMLGLGLLGIGTLFFALFVPGRWQVPYSVEVVCGAILLVIVMGGAYYSTKTVDQYWADVPDIEAAAEEAGKVEIDYGAEAFDKAVSAYLYQWGFIFINPDGSATRNALAVEPGDRVLVHILANDVIHGFQIPAARIVTEVDPKAVRSIWFRAPEEPGKYLIQCVDYCGIGHHQMKAWLVVGDGGGADEDEKEHS